MKRFIYILLISYVLFQSTGCNSFLKPPKIQQGYIDLSDWDFEKDGNIALDGDWEFYWNHLYSPSDFKKDIPAHTGYTKVPGFWNGKTFGTQQLSGLGYATYRLKIKLDSTEKSLGLQLGDACSSYNLWVNDALASSNGVTSSNPDSMHEQFLPAVVTFSNVKNELQLILQVSNNFQDKGGIWTSILLGKNKKVIHSFNFSIIIEAIFIGLLFTLCVYHLFVYFRRPVEYVALYFALFCFILTIRLMVTSIRVFYQLFPDFNLGIGYRMEYLGFIVGGYFGYLFYYYLYPDGFAGKLNRTITVVTVLETIVIIFTGTRFYSAYLTIFQIIFLIILTLIGYLVIKAFIKKKPFAKLSLVFFTIILILAVNDNLYATLIINTAYLSPYGLFFLMLSQAYLLTSRYAEAFHTVEITAAKLNEVNITLEQKVQERTFDLEEEKKKSDELLLNILPEETANELKQSGRSKAKTYGMVTVLFTDFKDFTLISGQVVPELLVAEIDYCFSAFDKIIQKHRIEKIKTIGDAYMCAAGVPAPSYTHAKDAINAALEIREFIKTRKNEKLAKGEIPFEIRIGIHSGPVVAGVVGAKKFAYDIWGDTVNMAARMEQNSEAGKINISGSTYELIKNDFECTHRGKIEAKNKGMIDMYFVN